MMNAEIKRDLFIIRKNYVSTLVFLVISIPLFESISFNGLGSLIMTVSFMVYTSIMMLEQSEDLYKYSKIINSFPITRMEIVKAKFEVLGLVYFVCTILALVTHYIYAVAGITKYIYLESFIVGLSISFFTSIFYGCVIIMLSVRYGYEKVRYVGIFITMLLFSIMNIVVYLITRSDITYTISALFVVLGILVLKIAFTYTLKAYNNKEF